MYRTDSDFNRKDSNQATRAYLDSLMLEQRLMNASIPDTKAEYFGYEFDTPIMTTALSHLGPSEHGLEDGMCEYAAGARDAGALHFIGMCEDEDFARYMEPRAKTIRIIKPYMDENKIFAQIDACKKYGAIGCGIDIDHAFSANGDYDICLNETMEPKSMEQIAHYIQYADMPYVIKGVLSVHDALLAREVGASGIVVSHHGGRMHYAVPPMYLLPDIKKAVGNDLKIFVDGRIASGMDAYKVLALGADGACVGHHLMDYVKSGGAKAVSDRLKEMNGELRGIMAFTGVKNTKEFDASVIHQVLI